MSTFPSDSLVSLLTLGEGHMASEIGLVGREGMLGIPLALGISSIPRTRTGAGSGNGLRMTSAHFSQENQKHGALHKQLNRLCPRANPADSHTATCNRMCDRIHSLYTKSTNRCA